MSRGRKAKDDSDMSIEDGIRTFTPALPHV